MKDLGIDINAKQNSTIYKGLKQLKQLNIKKGQEKQRAIQNMINKFENDINKFKKQINTWNITGKIKLVIRYNAHKTTNIETELQSVMRLNQLVLKNL